VGLAARPVVQGQGPSLIPSEGPAFCEDHHGRGQVHSLFPVVDLSAVPDLFWRVVRFIHYSQWWTWPRGQHIPMVHS
jgi:hypothetical protein